MRAIPKVKPNIDVEPWNRLEGFFFGACGVHDTTQKELEELILSDASAVLIKSTTIEPREGNPEPRHAVILHVERGYDEDYLQAIGLANLGYKEYIEMLPKLFRLMENHKISKPLGISIAGIDAEDYIIMTDAFNKTPVDFIEWNLSCPNVNEGELWAYKPEVVADLLESVELEKPTGFKLPRFETRESRQKITGVVDNYGINFVTLINSLGGCAYANIFTGEPITSTEFASLSGPALHTIALGEVKKFRKQYLDRDARPVIHGCGGVINAISGYSMLLHGADLVQVGTCLYEKGPGGFTELNNDLDSFVYEYEISIEEERNKFQSRFN